MKEALYYSSSKGLVHCSLCPHNCRIAEGKTGICNVRKNTGGKLYSFVYGRPTVFQVDPIEKKPLYHFLPGTTALSFGTIGCNLSCMNCQNWEISNAKPDDDTKVLATAKETVRAAVDHHCSSIAFTYNEPTIFYEYMLDVAKEAKKQGVRCVMVTNGYINPEPLKELLPYIDGANVDLKSFEDGFYKDICKAALDPVLETLKAITASGTHLEITTLIIPGKNDDMDMLQEMFTWIIKNLGNHVPIHLSAFHPDHKMMEVLPTNPGLIEEIQKTAMECGLRYVYPGNTSHAGITFCPGCKTELIVRRGFSVLSGVESDGKCQCGEEITGVFR